MNGFLYSTALQWRLDLRSRTMLIACYAVPLAFFAFMGAIFTSVMPGSRETLIPSMTVFAVSMGALIGLPPSLAEIYGSDIRRAYQANGVPLGAGLAAASLSALTHLLIMSGIICLTGPVLFDAPLPEDPAAYSVGLVVFTAASLGYASIIGLVVKDANSTSLLSILVFLPSIMLSGIMFPASMLPDGLQDAGNVFPATWGFRLLASNALDPDDLWPLLLMLALSAACCLLLLRLIRLRRAA